jgi:hypothetical protein
MALNHHARTTYHTSVTHLLAATVTLIRLVVSSFAQVDLPKPLTLTAHSIAAFIDIRISFVERMAPLAVGLFCMQGRDTKTPAIVLIRSHRFKVIGPYAKWITTQVVNLHPLWNRSISVFVRPLMGLSLPLAIPKVTVSPSKRSFPKPTSFRLINKSPESFDRIAYGDKWDIREDFSVLPPTNIVGVAVATPKSWALTAIHNASLLHYDYCNTGEHLRA